MSFAKTSQLFFIHSYRVQKGHLESLYRHEAFFGEIKKMYLQKFEQQMLLLILCDAIPPLGVMLRPRLV